MPPPSLPLTKLGVSAATTNSTPTLTLAKPHQYPLPAGMGGAGFASVLPGHRDAGVAVFAKMQQFQSM